MYVIQYVVVLKDSNEDRMSILDDLQSLCLEK